VADLAALLPTMTLALAILLIGLILIALAVWLLIRQVREQRRRRRIDDMLQELAERRLAAPSAGRSHRP